MLASTFGLKTQTNPYQMHVKFGMSDFRLCHRSQMCSPKKEKLNECSSRLPKPKAIRAVPNAVKRGTKSELARKWAWWQRNLWHLGGRQRLRVQDKVKK